MGKIHRFLRLWHKWVGVVAAVAMISFAITGIMLNNKEAFGLKPKPVAMAKEPGKEKDMKPKANHLPEFTTATSLLSLPVSFEQAMAIGKKELGQAKLDKIELKNEKGWLHYKVQTLDKPHSQVLVDAASGAVMVRKPEPGAAASLEGFVMDLHHFNFWGGKYKIVADLFAGSLALLTASGLWIFYRQETSMRRAKKLAAQMKAKTTPERGQPAASPALSSSENFSKDSA